MESAYHKLEREYNDLKLQFETLQEENRNLITEVYTLYKMKEAVRRKVEDIKKNFNEMIKLREALEETLKRMS